MSFIHWAIWAHHSTCYEDVYQYEGHIICNISLLGHVWGGESWASSLTLWRKLTLLWMARMNTPNDHLAREIRESPLPWPVYLAKSTGGFTTPDTLHETSINSGSCVSSINAHGQTSISQWCQTWQDYWRLWCHTLLRAHQQPESEKNLIQFFQKFVT